MNSITKITAVTCAKQADEIISRRHKVRAIYRVKATEDLLISSKLEFACVSTSLCNKYLLWLVTHFGSKRFVTDPCDGTVFHVSKFFGEDFIIGIGEPNESTKETTAT